MAISPAEVIDITELSDCAFQRVRLCLNYLPATAETTLGPSLLSFPIDFGESRSNLQSPNLGKLHGEWRREQPGPGLSTCYLSTQKMKAGSDV